VAALFERKGIAGLTVSLTPAPQKHQRLYYRVIAAVSLIVLVLVSFVAIGVTNFVYQAEQSVWQSYQDEAAHNAALSINTFINQVQEYMKLVGAIDRTYLQVNPREMEELLQHNPALLEVVRLDRQGKVFAGAYQDNRPVLRNTFTVQQSGWFNQALAGQPYVGNLEISADGEPYIILAIPDEDDGVVAVRLRMTLLWDVVEASRFGKTGQAYIVDREGNLVAHSNHNLMLERTTLTDRPEMKAMLAAPGNKWRGAYQNIEGVSVVGATLPISMGGWVIFTEAAQTEMVELTYKAAFSLGGGVLLLGLLMVLLTGFVLRRLVLRPIENLHDGANRIGQGDLSYRLQSEQPNEIGQVALAFNEMATKLQDREQKLAEARDQALGASRLKSQLLANVSHDLRTPLNAILGYSEMLYHGVYGPLSDDQQQITERIIKNTYRQIGMVKTLLNQAQLDAQTLKLEVTPFAPADLIEATKTAMLNLAEREGLALNCQLDPTLPPTLAGDFNWLCQILNNLVENAIKFTEQGSIQVRLYRHDNTYWAIQVADTGAGIPFEAQAYIFEAFRQVDGTATRDHKGVGLGLSIVKQVTDLMGGQVILESEPGQGSTFTVLLPFTPAQETIHE
jgi:signal transduction histidine kinase